jgi:hypothetical protein
MSTKTQQNRPLKTAFRYEPEDLEPQDNGRDQAALDAHLDRNKDALTASIEQSRAEFERGEYFTLDQVMADIDAQRQRRRASKV